MGTLILMSGILCCIPVSYTHLETMVAEDTQMVESAIQGLHRKGFSVMMDDFGSGYSSLNMLKDTNRCV